MDFNYEYNRLIKLIKQAAKDGGGKITNEEIAKKLEINRTYLSALLNGKEEVKEKHINLLKYTFQKELLTEAGRPLPGDRTNPIRALLAALLDDYAIFMEKEGKGTYDEIRDRVKSKASLIQDNLDSWLPQKK